jgi:hypothetical protein
MSRCCGIQLFLFFYSNFNGVQVNIEIGVIYRVCMGYVWSIYGVPSTGAGFTGGLEG